MASSSPESPIPISLQNCDSGTPLICQGTKATVRNKAATKSPPLQSEHSSPEVSPGIVNQSFYDNVNRSPSFIDSAELVRRKMNIFSPRRHLEYPLSPPRIPKSYGTEGPVCNIAQLYGQQSDDLLDENMSVIRNTVRQASLFNTVDQRGNYHNFPVDTSTVVRSGTSKVYRPAFGAWTDTVEQGPLSPVPSHTNVIIHSSDSTCGIMCRICHEGESKESLISPCKCAGTMGMMHRSCIERWLGSSNTSKCEICGYEYLTKKIKQSFREWTRSPARIADRRNLIGDLVCFLVLTPLASVSAWLCISGAKNFSKYADGTAQWETCGLIVLSIFLVLIYLVWCVIAVRYHSRVFFEWQAKNPIVHVIDQASPDPEGPNNNNVLRAPCFTSMPDIINTPMVLMAHSPHRIGTVVTASASATCMSAASTWGRVLSKERGTEVTGSMSDTFIQAMRNQPSHCKHTLSKETYV